MTNIAAAFKIMGLGMAGIFTVIIIILLTVCLLRYFDRRSSG